ncbi:MAG: Alkaline phosphatase PhoV [Gemmatimonadaceae bacterium]|nr:Alkaline phosphatase PhoV [Gemmatimonadaceae bacterium]
MEASFVTEWLGMMRRTLIVFALLVWLPSGVVAQPIRPRATATTPTLIVFLTIDQFRPDYLTLFAPQFTGGLARLTSGGAVFLNGFQDHAITETAPGHASTMSGRFPRSTGIVANAAGVNDPESPLVGVRGDGASPFRFRGTVLADWLRYADPTMRAVSVSRKDRGAILPLGRAKQDVFWFGPAGAFTTSTYYADTLPDWVKRFNARQLPQSFAGKSWTLLLDQSQYPEPDSVWYEGGGRDFLFPHLLPRDSSQAAVALAGVPMMDQVTLALALDGLQQRALGTSDRTDLLAVSLSSTDAVGHRYGPDSREIHDQILRLDRYLGAFFDSLFKLRDSTRVLVALTADHAVAPLPEAKSRYPNAGADRVELRELWAATQASLVAAGADPKGIGFDEGILYLHPGALAVAKLKPDSVARAFARAAMRVNGVLRVDLVSELARKDTVKDYVARRWIHMLPPDVPAAAVVTLKPYWYREGVNYSTHGTPHDYDANVPIILWGARIKPGRYPNRVRVVDLAPTLAELAGIRPMERLDGQVLRVAMRP